MEKMIREGNAMYVVVPKKGLMSTIGSVKILELSIDNEDKMKTTVSKLKVRTNSNRVNIIHFSTVADLISKQHVPIEYFD